MTTSINMRPANILATIDLMGVFQLLQLAKVQVRRIDGMYDEQAWTLTDDKGREIRVVITYWDSDEDDGSYTMEVFENTIEVPRWEDAKWTDIIKALPTPLYRMVLKSLTH